MIANIPVSRFLLAAGLCALATAPAQAEVKPNPLFSPGVVLQRNSEVPIWGTADKGEKVTVEINGQKASTVAKNGKWKVTLNNLAPGGPYTLKISGNNELEIRNVLVGEVWVCSGQSNMAWPLSRSAGADQHIAASTNSQIRLFTVTRQHTDTPLEEVDGVWKECRPENTRNFSAVAYFFGRDLQKALGVPVGLIQSAVGGTPAEAWTSRKTLNYHSELKGVLQRYEEAVKNYPETRKIYDEQLALHEAAVKAARAEGKPLPQPPRPPYGPESQDRPGALYNGMIAPLQPFAIRGVIWYQGESNANRAHEYRRLFPAMVQNWRDDWGRKDFPFLFVQLAPYRAIRHEPYDSAWAELREAQRETANSLAKMGMVVITDAGDENDIHPTRKEVVGQRLALAARRIAYGQKVVWSGPSYRSQSIEGSRIVLSFNNKDGGLITKGGPLTGFQICGNDRVWHNALAEIQKDRVVVWSHSVDAPIAVRYGWADYPTGNLWNGAGFPASPFRTDDFPFSTAPRP